MPSRPGEALPSKTRTQAVDQGRHPGIHTPPGAFPLRPYVCLAGKGDRPLPPVKCSPTLAAQAGLTETKEEEVGGESACHPNSVCHLWDLSTTRLPRGNTPKLQLYPHRKLQAGLSGSPTRPPRQAGQSGPASSANSMHTKFPRETEPANAFWKQIFTCKAIKGLGDTCDPQLQSSGQGGRDHSQAGAHPAPANGSAASPHCPQVWTDPPDPSSDPGWDPNVGTS